MDLQWAGMTPPVLLAVDDDAESLAAVERELVERYGRHYSVRCVRSPDDAVGLAGRAR